MATITKRNDTYRIRVSCGYDSKGKQIMKSTSWKPSPGMTKRQIEKELERQKVLFEEKCRTGQFLDGSIKFADFTEKWLADYADKQLKAKTVARYKELLKRILPAIGHIRLDKLQPHHIISLYENLEESGIKQNTPYKPIVDIKQVMKQQNLTIATLTELSCVSTTTIHVLRKGNSISKDSAAKVSNALNMEMDKLFKPIDANQTLSQKTILHHHRLISSILTTAVQWQVIFSNPCSRVKPPKVEQKEARYLDEIQVAELFICLDKEPLQYRAMITLLIYSGMRRGELCGLKWSDLDMNNKLLNIQRTVLYLPEKGIFEDSTKNYSSKRVIKIADVAFSLLLDHKACQNKQRIEMGDQWHDTEYIFTQANGKAQHPDSITKWFQKFIEKNNLPSVSIHSLRHTNAMLLIANGINLTTVANRLGHANTATTAKVYSHAIKTADEIAADTLQDILNPIKKIK